MTRINCIPVGTLNKKQLHAEYVELPVVFYLVRKMLKSGRTTPASGIPERFVHDTGHLTFFYDKLGYLLTRYDEIVTDLTARGYNLNPTDLRGKYADIPQQYFGTWSPDKTDMAVNQARVSQRLDAMKERAITGERYPEK